VTEDEKISRIRVLLKAHPKGLTITDISSKLKMNRNSAAKYLEILQISGHVESKSYGTAKVYFLSHRLPISALVSVTSDLIVTLDEHYRILFVNEAFARLFSVKKEDLAGSHIVDIFKTGIGCTVLPGVFSDIIAGNEDAREVRLPRDSGDLFFKVRSMKTVFDDGSRGITILMEDVTREKADRIRLEEQEARYRGIVEDQTEFILRFLPDGTLSFVNAAYARFMEKKPEDLAGTPFSETIHTGDRAVLDQCLRSLSRENPIAAFESRSGMPEEATHWIAWTLRVMFDGGEKPTEYQAVGNDITEKKEADRKIQDYLTQMEFFSHELQEFMELSHCEDIYQVIGAGLSKILPDAAITVSSYDPGTTTTLTIRAAFSRKDHELFSRHIGRSLVGTKITVGPPPERFLTGKVYPTRENLFNTVFQQIPADICAGIEEALNLGEFYSVGLIWKTEIMGCITFALRKGQTLRNESLLEAYVRAASIALRRAVAEHALRESEHLYRSVLENMPDVFYRTDTEGNLVMASPSWAQLLGYSLEDEHRGWNVARHFYYEPEKRKDFLIAIAANGSVTDYEIVLKKKDGSPVHVSANSHIYYDKNGTILGVEGIVRDITERREADRKIRQNIGQMEFLSRKQRGFIMMAPSENIYDRIATDVTEMVPGAIVLVNTFDPQTGIVRVQSAALSGHQREVITRALGKDVTGCEFRIDAAGTAAFRKGTLQKAENSLYEVVFRSLPEPVCTRLQAELGLGDMFAAGFIRGDEILGNLAVFLEPGKTIPDRDLLESYVRGVSIILQKHIAEEARHRSEEIFTTMARNAPSPIALIEPDGTYRYINESFTRMFGYDLHDFRTGKEWFRLAYPDPLYRRKVIATWKSDLAASRIGDTFPRTWQVRCKDGTVKEVIFRPVIISDGMLSVVYVDITEQKRAVQAHRLLSLIIETTGDAVIAKDTEGMILSWNKAAEELYGYQATEMIGCNISRIIPADMMDEMESISGRINGGEPVRNLKTRRVRKDGGVIEVCVTISPIPGEGGGVIGASTIARRITHPEAEERRRVNGDQERLLS
jgi:PAS domain S-box-containing protein